MRSRPRTKSRSPKPGRQEKQEIRLTKQEILLQPWFLPKRVARTIWGLVPADYRKRLHDYFDDYGCMRCSRLDVPYKSNGMCFACFRFVFSRLQQSMIRRSPERLQRRYGRELVGQAAKARKLLSEFSCPKRGASKASRFRTVRLSSPVIESFSDGASPGAKRP